MELTKTNYVDLAEEVVNKKIRRGKNNQIELTTSKIRNILSITSTIFDKVKRKTGQLDEDEQADAQLLRMRLVYESGREAVVKDFVEKSNLLEYIKNIGNDREKLILICKYIEALVAYHKFYGGRD